MKDRHAKHGHEQKEPRAEPAKDAAPAEPAAAASQPPTETDQLKDRLLRLQADFDNFRKRTAREKAEWTQRAAEDLVTELLPVIDHFELGLRTAREHKAEDSVVGGFQLVFDQLMGVLTKAGLKVIDAEGETFDPHQHEAVTHMPSDTIPADRVIAQTRRGYRLGEKLLRAAQVVVSSGPANGTDPDAAHPEAGD